MVCLLLLLDRNETNFFLPSLIVEYKLVRKFLFDTAHPVLAHFGDDIGMLLD